MREIKFRAWEEDVKFMNDQVRITVNPFGANKTFFEVTDGFNWKEVNPEHVMQFTGLKDKNGKEIYEGDIARVWDEEPYSNEMISTDYDWEITGDIVHREGCFWLKTKEDRHIWIPLFDYLNGHMELKIIGNIYENPSLLEQS